MGQYRGLIYAAFAIVLLSCLFCEAEARRKVLRGRKVFTREYYSKPLLPVWGKIILIGVGILLGGALLYFLLWKFLVDSIKLETNYSQTQALFPKST